MIGARLSTVVGIAIAPRSAAILGGESGNVHGVGQSTSTPESRATNAL